MATATITLPEKASARPEDFDAKTHHNTNGKGFLNPWASFNPPSGWELFKWIFETKILGSDSNIDVKPPTVPVRKPEFLPTRETPDLRATWLGHASYYVEFPGGLRVLFDPVFTERCSPSQSYGGAKRYTPPACQVKDLPFVDVVVVSHNHYDHMSKETLAEVSKYHPEARFFSALGNKPWFEKQGLKKITELDWWEERDFHLVPASSPSSPAPSPITARLSCLPAQHQTARTAFDKCQTLWSSWSIHSGGRSLWFSGDTGYRTVPQLPDDAPPGADYGKEYSHLPHCPAFEQIGRLRGPFDLGLLPIGAYHPRALMSCVHANPYDAVNIFKDTRCKRALGMHWGTWVLTGEPVREPPKLLREALRWKGLPEQGLFDVCDIGESRAF